MVTVKEIPVTQIGLKLVEAMDVENLSINDVAKEIGVTYEYIRRVMRGINNPSLPLLKVFAQRFNWDVDELELILAQDRFRKRNGTAGAMAQPRNPEVEPLEKGWHLLGDKQKTLVMKQFYTFVEQNRRRTRGGLC